MVIADVSSTGEEDSSFTGEENHFYRWRRFCKSSRFLMQYHRNFSKDWRLLDRGRYVVASLSVSLSLSLSHTHTLSLSLSHSHDFRVSERQKDSVLPAYNLQIFHSFSSFYSYK
jgi:hypothetical protein